MINLDQARMLALANWADEQIADFFKLSLHEMAVLAMTDRAFCEAITPTDDDRLKWERKRTEARDRVNKAKRRRLASCPSARVVNSMRARMWAAVKGRSDGALFSRLMYSREELVAHLESRFQPGMSWANYGTWHIDHIRPCVSFDMTDACDFEAAWALDNLQPLWASDNVQKGVSHG